MSRAKAASSTAPVAQMPFQQAEDHIGNGECRQFRVNRADFSPRRRGGEHLRELRLPFLHQVGELGCQRLSLHTHSTEFGHVNPEEVLVGLEVIQTDLHIGTQLVPPGACRAHGGSRVGIQPPGLFQECRQVDLFFGRKVEVEGALSDTGFAGDIVYYRICIALAGKHGPRSLQNATAPLLCGQLATR